MWKKKIRFVRKFNEALSEDGQELVELMVKEICKLFEENICRNTYTDFSLICHSLCCVMGIAMKNMIPQELHDTVLQLAIIQINEIRKDGHKRL